MFPGEGDYVPSAALPARASTIDALDEPTHVRFTFLPKEPVQSSASLHIWHSNLYCKNFFIDFIDP